MKNVLIIGATSDIARAVAHRLAKEGSRLVLAGRSVQEVERLAADLKVRYGGQHVSLPFEATDVASHAAFFAEAVRQLDGLDGVILCYGYMADQKKAEADFGIAREMIDVNFSSCVSILHLAADYLETKRQGFICAISSVAGDRGRQSNYIYGAAKGALSLFLQGLRNRLARAEVAVITVKPGFVDTKMTYGKEGMFLVAKPDKVAGDIVKAIRKRKHVVYTPFFWRWIMLVIRLIPENIFKRLSL
jgi:short-subunit dehydrogenase